jgi:hypothetical protein
MKKLVLLALCVLCVMLASGVQPAKAEGDATESVVWSPNSEWVAYPCKMVDPMGNDPEAAWRVCVTDTMAENVYVSSPELYGWNASTPSKIAWSPDSKHLAFLCATENKLLRLCIADPQLKNVRFASAGWN